ncbi:putative membrane protein, partial [Yersinia pestis PY-34]
MKGILYNVLFSTIP